MRKRHEHLLPESQHVSRDENHISETLPESPHVSRDEHAISETLPESPNVSRDENVTDYEEIVDSQETTGGTNLATNFPHVVIRIYNCNRKLKRVYDKRQSCYFCIKMVSKMARHLKSVHSDESVIAKILAIPDQKQQAFQLERYRLNGNFNHNLQILREKRGELLVARRPTYNRVVEQYLPCLHCYDFIDIGELWRHVKYCLYNERCESREEELVEEGEGGSHCGPSIITSCRMLLAGASDVTLASQQFTELKTEVLDSVRAGSEKRIIEHDELILRFGSGLLMGGGKSKKYTISSRMRQLARLLIEIRKKIQNINLSDCLSAKHFDNVVLATRTLAGHSQSKTMNGVNILKIPSLGLHIGHSLVKCTAVKRGQAIRKQNVEDKEDALDFKELFDAEWHQRISSLALESLKESSYNKEDILPLTSDLVKLSKLLETTVDKCTKSLTEKRSKENWTALAKALFVALTLFNKRRGGEVAALHLSSYQRRPHWNEVQHQEMVASLSNLEKKLVERFDMLQLPGKRNRRVPLLMKPAWVSSMDILVNRRLECDVRSDYFFAVPGKQSYINPWQVLRKFAVMAECERPDLVSTTRLRKYTATVTQLLSLTEGEVEWLGNHLGHSIEIHRQIYRQHESTVELAKVSKILLAVEQGNVSQWRGKSLKDINIDDITVTVENEEVRDNAIEGQTQSCSSSCTLENTEPTGQTQSCSSSCALENTEPTVKITRKRKSLQIYDSSDEIGQTQSCSSSCTLENTEPTVKITRKRKSLRIYDSSDEIGQTQSCSSSCALENTEPTVKITRKRKSLQIYDSSDEIDDSGSDYVESGSTISSEETTSEVVPRKIKRQILPKKRQAYTDHENTVIKQHFEIFIKQNKIPTNNVIRDFLKKIYPLLKERSISQIKSKVQHLIKLGY